MNGSPSTNQPSGRGMQWQGYVSPVQKRPRTSEVSNGDCPFVSASGYAGNCRITLKDVTIEYPQPAISFGLNIGGKSSFATFRDTNQLRNIAKFINEQCDIIEKRIPELQAKSTIMLEQIHKAQEEVKNNSRLAELVRILNSGGQIDPITGEIKHNPLNMSDVYTDLDVPQEEVS